MIAKTPASNLVSVYDGTTCLGHVLYKPRVGYEAYDCNDRPIGIYPTQKAAADAISLQEERCTVPETPRCPR
jgi:hypothetical protein